MLFGVPENKWELWDGRVRWAFPFDARDVVQAHFEAWAETLRRWRGGRELRVHEATTENGSPRDIVRLGGVEMSLFFRSIELRIPLGRHGVPRSLLFLLATGVVAGAGPGSEVGRESPQRHHDVQHNLWRRFGE